MLLEMDIAVKSVKISSPPTGPSMRAKS